MTFLDVLVAFVLVVLSGVRTQNVLIVGDSQACAMGFGATTAVKSPLESVDVSCKVGARTSYWTGDRMRGILSKKTYDVVIVFLGSNDVGSNPDPSEVVESIERAGVRACVWVGPPALRGVRSRTSDVLGSRVAPCAYLDSQSMDIPLADGVHPTGAGAVKWLKRAWKTKDDILNGVIELRRRLP